MLDLKCDKCGGGLKQPGALVFSPPLADGWTVEKFHLCVDCWLLVSEQLRVGQRPAISDPTSRART